MTDNRTAPLAAPTGDGKYALKASLPAAKRL